MLYVADFVCVWGWGGVCVCVGGGGSQTDSSAEASDFQLFLNRYLPYNLQIMCVAFVRYCMVLDCEPLIHLDFSSLFVIHVWHLRFFLNGITKYLTWAFIQNKCFCMKRVQQNRNVPTRSESSSFFRTESGCASLCNLPAWCTSTFIYARCAWGHSEQTAIVNHGLLFYCSQRWRSTRKKLIVTSGESTATVSFHFNVP